MPKDKPKDKPAEKIFELTLFLKSGQSVVAFVTSVETERNPHTGKLEVLTYRNPGDDYETLLYVDIDSVEAITVHRWND